MANLSNLSATSEYDGFKNLPTVTASTVVNFGGFAIAANGYVKYSTAIPSPLGSNILSQVQVSYPGVDSNTYLVPGFIQTNYPNNVSNQYSIQSMQYLIGNNLTIDTFIINQTPSPLTVPNFTINVTAFFYVAPF